LGLLLRHNTLPKRPVQRLVDLSLLFDAYQFSTNPFLDNSRVTDSPRMSFSLHPKLTRNKWLTFAIGKAVSERVDDKRPCMASLNVGQLLRQLGIRLLEIVAVLRGSKDW
jgi:hypothetical protein